MLEFELLVADPRALFYCPLDRIPGHALLARLLDHRRKARIAREITAPHLRSHHDFFHEFADGLALFQASHFPLGVQPLTTHAPSYPAGEPVASVRPCWTSDGTSAARTPLVKRLPNGSWKEKRDHRGHA